VWYKEIYSPILYKKISPEEKNVMSNRKRVWSKTHARQMNNNIKKTRSNTVYKNRESRYIYTAKRREVYEIQPIGSMNPCLLKIIGQRDKQNYMNQ